MEKMYNIIILFFFLIFTDSFSQTITFTDIDVTQFPTVRTSFMALDPYGNSYTDITTKDFEVYENGAQIPSNLLNVNCKISPMKVVLVLDKSTSMQDMGEGDTARKWDWVVEGAMSFIKSFNFANGSEIALTVFASDSYLKCDFTNDQKLLYDSIMTVTPYGKTNFNKAFFGPFVGALELLRNQPATFRRIIVFLTDGMHDDLEFGPMMPDSISNSLVSNNIQLYAITLLSPINKDLNQVAMNSGGNAYTVSTKKQLNNIYLEISEQIKNKILCVLSWPTSLVCDDIERYKIATIKYIRHGYEFSKLYTIPENGVAKINTDEKTYKFGNPSIGSYSDVKIKLTPENSDASISNISINPSTYFSVLDYGFGEGNPPVYPINIPQGTDYYITVRFTPKSLKTFRKANLIITSSPCSNLVPLIGGIPEVFVDEPFANNIFSKCDSINIVWSGVDPSTPTDLFYSINGGNTWTQIAKSVTGNLYKWRPGFESPTMLIKAEVSPTQSYVWAMSGGGKYPDIANGIAISKDSLSVYICGYISSSAIFSEQYISSKGKTDAFLAKYDTDGNLLWMTTDGGIENDSAFSVVTDVQDNVFYVGTCMPESKVGNIVLPTPIYGNPYLFVAKYSPDGKVINANAFGANTTYVSFRTYGRSISNIGNNIVVVGEYTGEMKWGNVIFPFTSAPRTFTLTYDRNLSLLSVFVNGAIQKVTKVKDKDNFTYQIWNFTNYQDFDRYTVKSEGNYDMALTKYGSTSEGFDISDEFGVYSPILKSTLNVLDFGNCLVGDTCKFQFTDLIENPGKVPAKISGFEIKDTPFPTYLRIDSTIIGKVLAPGEFATVNAEINSYTRGNYSANLRFYGDCDEETTIPVKSYIDCQTKTLDTINFGQVFVNTTKTIPVTCLIENLNGIDLPINPVLQGKNANEFGLIKIQPDTVKAKNCYIIDVTFTPRQLNERTGRINLLMKDPCGNQLIQLVGYGVNPSAVLPDEIDWGTRRINKNYDSTVKIYNPTASPMYLEDIYFSKSLQKDEFKNTNDKQFPIELLPKATTEIPIAFYPTDDINYSGEITYKIKDRDSIVNVPVKLKGKGFYPQFEYEWNCGNSIKPGDSSVASLRITNTSKNSELSIDRIMIALKNGIYEWANLVEPTSEKIPAQESRDYFVNFYPKDVSPNLNNLVIMADDYDGIFPDFWKETRFSINCQAIGVNYPSDLDFGNKLICSNSAISVRLENQNKDTDIEIDFPNSSFSGIQKSAFSTSVNSKIIIKAGGFYDFSVLFKPTVSGKYSTVLTLVNNFDIPMKINITGIAKIFTLSANSKEFSEEPGKFQFLSLNLKTNNLDDDINSLNLDIYYNFSQIRFDTTYFEDGIKTNWTWTNKQFANKGIVKLEGSGDLAKNYDGTVAKFKIQFMLDTIKTSKLIYVTNYDCANIPDTVSEINTIPVCFDEGRKIIIRLDNQTAILEPPTPNPTSDYLTLSFSCAKEFNAQVKLYDLMGNTVGEYLNKKYKAGIYTEKIKLDNIHPGVYFLEFTDGFSKTVEKITIAK